MFRLPIAILILSVLTFGLLITASPTPDAQAAPRTIPWDCSDWQETPAMADADDARVSMILESLAANRGKSIYCAVDQSDTWTKSETWLAGRDRNERDDTVYFGEQGNFRGFLAAQEGYLTTDGESGVTGISRDRIFEFPEEPRRGKKTVIKRLKLEASPDRWAKSADGAQASSYDRLGSYGSGSGDGALGQGWRYFCDLNRPGYSVSNRNSPNYCQGVVWEPLVQAAAERDCAARGYPRVNEAAPSGNWEFRYRDTDDRETHWGLIFWQVRQYTATCEKKIRVRC